MMWKETLQTICDTENTRMLHHKMIQQKKHDIHWKKRLSKTTKERSGFCICNRIVLHHDIDQNCPYLSSCANLQKSE